MRYELGNGLTINRYTWNTVDSNAYLIGNEDRGLLIDTVDSAELINEIEKFSDLTVILTHCHFDHIYGLNRIRKSQVRNINVVCTEKCSEKLGSQFKNMSSTANAFLAFHTGGEMRGNVVKPFICEPADTVFQKEYSILWCDHRIILTAVYGHTDDSLIVEMDDRWLFTGDTLLPFPTTTRFPSGSKKRFRDEDLPLLKSMAGRIECVFPGHGDPGVINDMISLNRV